MLLFLIDNNKISLKLYLCFVVINYKDELKFLLYLCMFEFDGLLFVY